MENPYQPPEWEPKYFQDQPPMPTERQNSGMVGQVRIISILMIAEGALDFLAGAFYCAMGIGLPLFMQTAARNDPNFRRGGQGDPETFFWFLLGIYVAMGLPGMIGGVLRIWAGIRNYQFKSRTLGLVALILGVGSAATCYCAPTSIALTVYGLVVYLNREVMMAFEMGRNGRSSEQILETFTPYRRP
jgi:hypothetical protein